MTPEWIKIGKWICLAGIIVSVVFGIIHVGVEQLGIYLNKSPEEVISQLVLPIFIIGIISVGFGTVLMMHFERVD
jgi:hypothetical protein